MPEYIHIRFADFKTALRDLDDDTLERLGDAYQDAYLAALTDKPMLGFVYEPHDLREAMRAGVRGLLDELIDGVE